MDPFSWLFQHEEGTSVEHALLHELFQARRSKQHVMMQAHERNNPFLLRHLPALNDRVLQALDNIQQAGTTLLIQKVVDQSHAQLQEAIPQLQGRHKKRATLARQALAQVQQSKKSMIAFAGEAAVDCSRQMASVHKSFALLDRALHSQTQSVEDKDWESVAHYTEQEQDAHAALNTSLQNLTQHVIGCAEAKHF
ncbi:MAG: hypothetical protein QF486_03820 [Candidatus Woesearchaeota archaeon]|jgi:hypothetical protein|nr:hypothetical protein [Candidatus Woesearchaeota archaeon]MDP7181635.1 hypothetical protein [Candidatus Woesearchaeota archaeon]MDP7198724.1 hypothetical protein [Candidatus Woesearchaeota archaeon]MDP7467276.1 hypothetical protein [Candidatus Woesearchaeota archaeon]MDP7647389.1 hypothetical protein [Candidatus Woesearchaeota archaeon]